MLLFWGCNIIKICFLPSVQAPEKGERMRATTILKGQQVAAKSKLHNVIRRHPTMPQLRRLTQEELLAEARITEEQNLASLAQFLKIEAEKKANKAIKVLYCRLIFRAAIYMFKVNDGKAKSIWEIK